MLRHIIVQCGLFQDKGGSQGQGDGLREPY